MKAQRLTLSNFRGFTQLELTFNPQLTILAGVNGSGKSGVLKALAALLSHLLREAGPSKEKPNELSVASIQVGKPALTISGSFSSNTGVYKALVTRTRVDAAKAGEYAKRRDEARFALRETQKGSLEEAKLKEEIRFLGELQDGDRDHYSSQLEPAKRPAKAAPGTNPLAVLYTTSRYLGRLAPRLSGVRAFEPANAYPEALSGAEVSLTAFANWFNAVEQGAVGSKADSDRLSRLLNKVVKALLPGFSDPQLTESSPPRFLVKKGRTIFELGQLSDGERGLLALAFDLTRRLAIANPGLSNPVAQGSAIVLLDEIELHLHPSWQRQVMRRLTETFKNCQFIATTHSPQVIGEAPPESLWMLDSEKGTVTAWQPDRFFGMDSNRLLEELMGTDSLNAGVKAELDRISALIDGNKFDQAKQAIEKLEPKLGEDHPELIRLRALIAFITREK